MHALQALQALLTSNLFIMERMTEMGELLKAVDDKLTLIGNKIDTLGATWKADLEALKSTVVQQELSPEAQKAITAHMDEILGKLDSGIADAKAATGPTTPSVIPPASSVASFKLFLPVGQTAFSMGHSFAFEVDALKGDGSVATDYLGTVRLTKSRDGSTDGGFGPDYSFIATDSGVHQFVGAFAVPGSYVITVTDIANPSITGSVTVFITAAPPVLVPSQPAATLAIGLAPGSNQRPPVGTRFSVTVTAKRADGSTADDYTGKVHLASTGIDFSGVTPGQDYQFTTSDKGSKGFDRLIATQPGSVTVTVSDEAGINGSFAVEVG